MTFEEVLIQVLALLQREKRISYRALKRRFDLDDDYLEDVKDELIYAKKLAVDEENRVLVWIGEQAVTHPQTSQQPTVQETQPTQIEPLPSEPRPREAELYRLKGELLLQQFSDNAIEAESCFQQAIAIAQHQSAKSWELRAATSLAKLWQSQRKRQDAYDLLAPVYGWFTEGFDTADLKDARALLDELA